MKFINQMQSKEERKFKYKVCRHFGLSRNGATKLKDWSINHIVLFLRSNTEVGKMFFSKDKIGNWTYSEFHNAVNPILD